MKRIVAVLLLCLPMPVFAMVSQWIPVEIENGHVIIPITLNGVPARAMLDTGATGHAISEVFLESQQGGYTEGTPLTISGITGTRQAHYTNDIKFGIFGAEFELDDLMPMPGDYVEFILGLPFFDLFIVQIDYPGQRMRIAERDDVDLREFANIKMKHEGGSGRPQVLVNMNGEAKYWLMLDTGNSSSILIPRSKAERQGWLERYLTTEQVVLGVNAIETGIETFHLPEITLGPFELENVAVSVPAEGVDTNLRHVDPLARSAGARTRGNKKTDGILGYDVLQHFVLTIDYRRGLLNLEVPR